VRDEAEHKGDSGAVSLGARRCRDAEGATYLDRLGRELTRVGIHGRLRDRILAEAADHLADGEAERFGEPGALAREFADELATARGRRAALASLAALAGAAAVFAAAWLLTAAAGGWGDIFSAEWAPLGVAAALGLLICPQVSFTAGLLVVLRVGRRRHERRLPAAEVALLLRRTRVALAFGALSLASVAVYAFEFRAGFSSWYVLSVVPAAAALTLPLAAAALLTRRAAAVKSSVPGEAGDVFDDLPVELPRRPWLLLAATACAAALAGLVAGGITNEGPRNAVAELVLVVAGFLAFGKRLGLRR
jgi:MFS family permease